VAGMAHFDLNEQEQLAQVKYFWKDWGKYLSLAVVLVIVAYCGSSAYSWYQAKQASKAAAIYNNFTQALTTKNASQVTNLVTQLKTDFPRTQYSALAALQAAKLAFENKNYPQAISLLEWVKANSSDRSLQSIAVLRLASVYIDQNNFDKAREMLRTKHDLAFDGLFYEGRGDLYIAMGDLTKARDAYKEGLQKAANDPTTQQSIQLKLDIIGG
jgi:predicted negative regulator of RcsB-dependent stress response